MMHNIESFKVSLMELRSNKLRTILTMLGIVFGVAAVIAMMSIGEGAKQEALAQIELLGTNNIIINKVQPHTNAGGKPLFSPGLTMKDSKAIKELNPFVKYITPVREMNMEVLYKSNFLQTAIIGTTQDYPQTFNTLIALGSFLKSFHLTSYSNICVIGYGIKEQLFKFEDPINKKIKIGRLWFTIIGVTSAKSFNAAGSTGFRNFNNDIYIPITTMMNKIGKVEPADIRQRRNSNNQFNIIDKNSVDQLTAKVKSSNQLLEASHLISKILERRHYGVKDYEIVLPEQLIVQKQKTQRIFNIVMGAIAGISLLVGGIGIMNIMLANILERTHEIGIRRAVGATKKDVLNQFIYEALTISITGGIAGIFVGSILTSLISTYAQWNTIIAPFSVVIAFIVSAAIGLIFGIYPAKQAAEKNPIDSLRYE